MTSLFAIALFVLLPAVALGLTTLNLVVWPRGRPDGRLPEGGLSVLVPARDEAETIEGCIRAIFASDHPVDEVVVYEDRSTDATPDILADLQEEFPRLRVVDGQPLPAGWVGKPHACHRLAEAAEGDVLVYVDADTILERRGLARLVGLLEEGPAGPSDLACAVPRQEYGSFGERLVLPLLHLTYTSWLPMPLIWRTDDPRFVAANGQLVALRRSALEEVGGFRSVRSDVVDDMALSAAFKRAEKRVVFADGFEIARCRMYRRWEEVWEGFSKNLFEGLGGRPALLGLVVLLYAVAFVAPYVGAGAFAAGWLGSTFGWAACAGVGMNVLLRGLLAARFRQPIEGIVVQPVAVVALLAIAVNWFRWHRRGEIKWAGRTYVAKHDR